MGTYAIVDVADDARASSAGPSNTVGQAVVNHCLEFDPSNPGVRHRRGLDAGQCLTEAL